jgi:hypothetical protein
MPRRRYRHTKSKQSRANERAVQFVVAAACIVFIIIAIVQAAQPYATVIRNIAITLVALIILWFIIRWSLKYYKNRKITGELESNLQKALIAMDQTSKTYTDEKEANKELATALRTLGLPVEYEFRLSAQRIADIKVGDVLIEGKLSPKTDEVDRLLGQLQDYCTYKYQVNIVIYGNLDSDSLKRISDEINNRYPEKAFLTYLKDPHRKRVEKFEPSVVIKKYYKR